MSLGACFQKKPFPRPAERAGSREPREPARAAPATLAAALHPAARHWTQLCYWKDDPLLPSHSVTSFACYRRRGQGDLLLAAFYFFFWRPGVAVEIWRTNEFISYHRWRLLPLAWGLAKLGVAPCPERGGSLCRGKVSGRTCVFPLGCCQVKCSRMRLLVYILCLWTNYICYWKLTYYKGGKRSNTTASWHSSSIRCTICTYLHLFAWILVTMLTSNFLMFFVFLFRRKLLNAACSMFSSVCVRNCLTHNWQPYL